ncbi:MAG: glycoside hydrolase family 57 protein [Thermodesulfovibrionales bacterium]|nr:glycoside hydrolase family 57 protein [Thermodesulfovibrionales bacterium]
MSEHPLYIAFFWHMHQPSYRDPLTGEYRLPWVRLHGTKDYLDMLLILEDFPEIHQTFNIVPSLFDQLIDYIERGAKDKHLILTLKSPSELTEDERMFVVENFFLANWDTMVKPYTRYNELLIKRGVRFSRQDIKRIHKYFTDDDIRDLQVWFNLVWIDPMFVRKEPFLQEMYKKGAYFTEEEKVEVINHQYKILRNIIPSYRNAFQKGMVELSVTPFYHPILPLLWDTNNARIAMPNVVLPKRRFAYPQDAQAQIKLGIEFFTNLFGKAPNGMWPSEGSVCEDIAKEIHKQGIRWIATDEDVLSASLGYGLRDSSGGVTTPESLYKPYDYEGIKIFFRDHRLSDQVGFVYSGLTAEDAVKDFIGKLQTIKNSLPKDSAFVVPVILDGENAWEYYKNDGHDFLSLLYETISKDKRFRAITMSEYLNISDNIGKLHKLHAGSWINANFGVWIGHEEDNIAWDYLTQVREDLERFALENPNFDISEAWRSIYAAEGSDWNWWYGDDHSTDTAEEFDELFRRHLMKVYEVIGKEIPSFLYVPVLTEDREVLPATQIKGFIYPKIDGTITSYYEWLNSAFMEHKQTGGSMHKIEGFITGLYYGFNERSFCIRLDSVYPFREIKDPIIVETKIIKPIECKIRIQIRDNKISSSFMILKDAHWKEISTTINVAVEDILEMEIPFDNIKAKVNDEIQFSVHIMKNGDEIERCPWRGYITLTCPSPDYEKMMWY